MPSHQRLRISAARQRTFDRRAVLRSATATSLGLAAGARLHRSSAQTPVANPALGDLQRRLAGALLLPEDSAFLATNAPVNRRYQDVIPTAIARCADEADVMTCVQWCVENGVEPVVRGGGHSYAGYSTTSGLLIDLRDLSSVTVDHAAGAMTIGGGATITDIFAALDDGPLFLPTGTCPTVGIGGLTLGGGIGHNTRWAGLTCDHLQHTRVVTANGEPLDVSPTQHSDLFWALRGGAGGSFGVNTSFTFNLVEVPSSPVTNFSVRWRGADAAGLVLRAFQDIIQDAPAEFGAAVVITPLDPAESGRRRSIDVSLQGHFIGPESDLQDLLAPLLELKTPPSDQTITKMPFWESQKQLLEPEGEAHAFTDISRFANAPLPDDVIQQIVSLLVNCPHRTDEAHGAITLFGWVGGILTQIPRHETAYVHRDMTALWRAGAVWPPDAPPSVGEELTAWTQEIAALIAPHTPNESYQNFPNRAIADWQQQYYAENLQRLIEVKTVYDPGNVFRNAQSIPVSLRT
jgi:FAD/FMN-containing dehydrogenase